MDKIDKQILNILQTNARASQKETGEATFLSWPAETTGSLFFFPKG